MIRQLSPRLLQSSSIARHILLVLVAAVLLCSAVVIGSTVSVLDTQLLERREQQLSAEVERLAQQFRSYIDEMVHDTAFLAGVPPIQGLMRSRRAGVGVGDSSTPPWRRNLQGIFKQMLAAKPMALQYRFIDVDGRELVRVDRYGPRDSVRAVAEEALQSKLHRDYVQVGLSLPKGAVWLSEIGLNREERQIMQPPHAVLRAVTGVYDDSGLLYGLLVVNHRVAGMFARIGSAAQDEFPHYITALNGEYLLHPDAAKAFRFEYGERSNIVDDLPQAADFLADSQRRLLLAVSQRHGDRQIYALQKVDYQTAEPAQQLVIAVSSAYRDALAVRNDLLKRLGLYVLALLLVLLAVVAALSQRIVAPLQAMRNTVLEKGQQTRAEDLPIHADAEVGELARAFSGLLAVLDVQRRALEREVGQRRRAQLELEKNLGKLAQANKELEQFAYIASHDLQEPLRTINSFIGMLEQRCGSVLDEQSQQFLEYMKQSASRMEMLIRGLLEYSRLDGVLELESVDCQALVADVCDDLASQISEKNAVVTYSGLPLLRGHALSLHMLFQNLIGNALKYSRDGVDPQIAISASQRDGEWLFSVTDNGIGICEQHRERVFYIFQRLHGRDEYSGSGIGLALCKKIVEQHGGRIWIKEGAGGGSCFCFTLLGEGNDQT